jgi:hypothetical protein
MEEYILEASDTVLCSPFSLEGCSDRQKEFISKWRDEPTASLHAEVNRLDKLTTGAYTSDLSAWMRQRKGILMQLLKASQSREEL